MGKITEKQQLKKAIIQQHSRNNYHKQRLLTLITYKTKRVGYLEQTTRKAQSRTVIATHTSDLLRQILDRLNSTREDPA